MEKSKLKGYLVIATYSIVLYLALTNISSLGKNVSMVLKTFSPFLYGFAFAYLLNGPFEFIQNRVLIFMDKTKNKKIAKLKRPFALVLTFALLILAITSFFAIIIPQLIASLYTLIDSLPSYMRQFEILANNLAAYFGLTDGVWNEIVELWSTLYNQIAKFVSDLLPVVLNGIMGVTSSVANVIIGFIVSIYVLMSKEKLTEQFKKIVYAFAPRQFVDRILDTIALADRTFGGFIAGQLTVALILGMLCFLFMNIFGMPYALLVSVIIGTTNIIPYFGPIIGAVPCTFIIMMSDPQKALYFVILIIVLQQLDGNIISPRIVGDSVGLTGIWVLFAITIGGGMFGILGMVLGVPTFAVLYTLFKELTYSRLESRGVAMQNNRVVERERNNRKVSTAGDKKKK